VETKINVSQRVAGAQMGINTQQVVGEAPMMSVQPAGGVMPIRNGVQQPVEVEGRMNHLPVGDGVLMRNVRPVVSRRRISLTMMLRVRRVRAVAVGKTPPDLTDDLLLDPAATRRHPMVRTGNWTCTRCWAAHSIGSEQPFLLWLTIQRASRSS